VDNNKLRNLRRHFENAVGLRTYSISWIKANDGDLFDADAPYDDREEEAFLAWLSEGEAHGVKLDFAIRNRRMTVKLAAK
jgi:hypothetical protein